MKKEEALKRLDAIEKEQKELRAIIEQHEETKKKRVVDSVDEIPHRRWFINNIGKINVNNGVTVDANDMSTKQRAEAVLALIQLLEIHAAIEHEGEFEVSVDLESYDGRLEHRFWFDSASIMEEFVAKHTDLIETVKRGL